MKRKKSADLDLNKEAQLEKMCLDTWKDLYRFIYYKIQNKEEAEDITQETYMKALDHIRKKHPTIDNPLGYLKVIALNIIRDNWRKEEKFGAFLQIDNVDSVYLESEDFSESTVNETWIKNALEILNVEQRKIIELRIIKGYSVEETAKVMHKKEGTIRVIQFRALKILANLFYKNNG